MIVTVNNLDLAQIADSGQCFRWNRLDETSFEVIAYDRYLKLKQNGNKLNLSCDEEQWNEIWSTYLDMDTDYADIGRRIRETDDEYLKKAYEHGQGIRILRQELWETLISFIISQNNNIKRIRGSIEAICRKAALPVTGDAPLEKYRFPKPTELDREFFNDWELGLGYRRFIGRNRLLEFFISFCIRHFFLSGFHISFNRCSDCLSVVSATRKNTGTKYQQKSRFFLKSHVLSPYIKSIQYIFLSLFHDNAL